MKRKIFTVLTILIVKLRMLLNWGRRFLLELQGASLGKDVKIYGAIFVTNPRRLNVGESTSLNYGVVIGCRGGVEIGRNCHISPMAQIHSGKLKIGESARDHSESKVVLEDGVWLASGVVVSPGVRIGKNSVVAANSVVVKDVPSGVFVSGVPASIVRKL